MGTAATGVWAALPGPPPPPAVQAGLGTGQHLPFSHLPFSHLSHPLFGHMFRAGPLCPCTPGLSPHPRHAPRFLFPATFQPLELVGM